VNKLTYNIKEAVAVSGINKDLLYAEINAGKLKTLKIGRRRLIRAEALAAWLEAHEQKTSEAMGFSPA